MNVNGKASAVILVAAALAFAGGAASLNSARADSGPNATCSSSAPCLQEDNSGKGSGLKGTSSKGNGVIGTTHAKGTGTTDAGAGVLGQDTQTATSGVSNAGVAGTSTNGFGVQGTTTSGNGVSGTSSSGNGILGKSTSGNGVFGSSTSRTGVEGVSTQEIGVRGVGSTIGIIGDGLIGAEGETTGGTAVLGRTTGVGQLLFRGNNHLSVDVFRVDDSGNVFAHSFQATLDNTVIQRNALGQRVSTYSQQASQPSLEDFGEAQLKNGAAIVRLDSAFAAAIDANAGYLVMITPEGDCRGLYVAARTNAGFTVREMQGGHSSVGFTYRIVARPFGDSSPRMPLATSVPRGS